MMKKIILYSAFIFSSIVGKGQQDAKLMDLIVLPKFDTVQTSTITIQVLFKAKDFEGYEHLIVAFGDSVYDNHISFFEFDIEEDDGQIILEGEDDQEFEVVNYQINIEVTIPISQLKNSKGVSVFFEKEEENHHGNHGNSGSHNNNSHGDDDNEDEEEEQDNSDELVRSLALWQSFILN